MSDDIIFRTSEIPAEVQGRGVLTPFFIQEVPGLSIYSSTVFWLTSYVIYPSSSNKTHWKCFKLGQYWFLPHPLHIHYLRYFFPFVAAWLNYLKASVKHEEQRIPWNRFPISKLITVYTREQKLPAAYETRIFIIVTRRIRDWYLSSTRWSTHTSSTHIITANFNIILPPTSRSPCCFFPCMPHSPSISSSLSC